MSWLEQLTAEVTGPSSLEGLVSFDRLPRPGTYADGLLVVLAKEDAEDFLSGWEWLVGENATGLITTGFGDVFYWSEGQVKWLNIQRATTQPIDPEVIWVLHEYLEKDIVQEKVLRRPVFEELVVRQRPLSYHEAFILKPWLIMGGEDRIDHYEIGHCGVYVDLVGQTWPQLLRL